MKLDFDRQSDDTSRGGGNDDVGRHGRQNPKIQRSVMSHHHQARPFVRGLRSIDPSQDGERHSAGGFSGTVSEARGRACCALKVKG